jgi:hypothetical protein
MTKIFEILKIVGWIFFIIITWLIVSAATFDSGDIIGGIFIFISVIIYIMIMGSGKSTEDDKNENQDLNKE